MEKTKTMKNQLLSFHGKPEIKEEYMNRLRLHYEMDEIVKGHYWEEGKGCAVGCTVHSSSHDAYEKELGISWRLAIMEDGIFEKLPNDQAKEFTLQFLDAIPVGVDTDLVFKKYILWILDDEKDGLIHVIKKPVEKEILQKLVTLYRESYTREIAPEEWEKLAKEADKLYASASASAYASASASASAYAYASASAYASAYAYASASASAYAYAYASASASASDEWYEVFNKRILLMRDKLIQFLKEAEVVNG